FRVMQCAWRNGVLDKFMVIQGEALEGVMADTGMNLGDLLNRLDEASEETVQKIDRLLDRAGPLMRHLDSDRLMRLASRLLDLSPVRKAMVAGMRANMARAATGAPRPSPRELVMALLGRTSFKEEPCLHRR
ncbi:MAG: hypothetical protein H5T74_14530, partial [Actinobacteria bacterium]|nr:hypothetical protein [Actinomycetota bacterium]